MTKQEKIKLYIEAYESGSHDLKSLNKWLKEEGVKLITKKGKIIEIREAA